MLKNFVVSGPDGSSDNGFWEVIVRAYGPKEAATIVKNHLREQKREDLIPSMSAAQAAWSGPVIWSTVEGKR